MNVSRLSSRLYELRTYTLRMDQMHAFLRGTEELFHLRTKHSAVLGYWTAELGGLNQVVHIWEYDDLKHRAAVRSRLAGDAEWAQKYVVPVLNPAIVAQDNLLMRAIDGTTVATPVGKGVCELQQLTLAGPASRWRSSLRRLAGAAVPADTCLVGCFEAVVGPMNDAVLVWHHASQNALLRAVECLRGSSEYDALQEHVVRSHSKLLQPHPVSPIQ